MSLWGEVQAGYKNAPFQTLKCPAIPQKSPGFGKKFVSNGANL
jgi:hypothetical protein